MNLIYMCVFHQRSYIDLLKLLLHSMAAKGCVDPTTTDILIFTSPDFLPLIKTVIPTGMSVLYSVLPLTTLMEASCCKLRIFDDFKDIDKYNKLLYLDTDVLINSDVNVLLNVDISSDKMYALEEGTIDHDYWGGQFITKGSSMNRETTAFSAGVFYFMNSPDMRQLFTDINNHIREHLKGRGSIPVCLDQPFLVYNAIQQNKYDNQLMKAYLENNPKTVSRSKIIYHFPGGPGNSSSKKSKMKAFLDKYKSA